MAGTRQKKLEIVFAGDAKGALRAMGQVEARGGMLGKGLKAGALGAGAAVAGIAVGAGLAAKALFDIGSSFDSAYDKIRIGTGATGADLEGLKGTFRDVFSSVPTDMESASTAVADLNTRLGLTGPELGTVSESMLELTRLTGGDLETNIAGVTRVFGDWSVDAADMPATLDEIFRASQSTGAGVDSLAQQVVQFGSPLRQMGFSLEESLALFGNFEKTGVNIETVMAGMRMGLANMAKAGEEPAEALVRIQDEIENAGSVGEANVLAIETFGQRAGPDMAAAIREGRFELTDLVAEIEGGSDTIAAAGEETQSFGEKWTLLKNRVLVALEPVATRVFEAVGDAMDKLGPIAQDVGEWLGERLPGYVEKAEAVFREDLLPVFESVASWVREHWPQIRDTIVSVFDTASETISSFVETISALWRAFGDDILRLVERVWGPIQQIISGAIRTIHGVIQAVLALIRGDWGEAWEAMKGALAGAWELILGIVKTAIALVRGVIDVGWQIVRSAFEAVWRGISGFFAGIWNAMVGNVRRQINTIRTVISTVWNGIRSITSTIWGAIRTTIRRALDGIRSGISTAKGAIERVWNGLKAVFRAPVAAVLRVVVNPFLGVLRSIAGVVGLDDRIPGNLSIPRFHSGGIVPGPRGQERPAMLLAGEGVVNLDGMDALGAAAFESLNRGRRAELTDRVLGVGDPPGAGILGNVVGAVTGGLDALGKIPGWISKIRGFASELGGIGNGSVLARSITGIPRKLLTAAIGWIEGKIRDLLSVIPGIGGGSVALGDLSGAVGSGGIVSVGRMMQAAGYSIYGHPVFGGPIPGVHTPTSYHYRNRAIDVNADGAPGGEMAALDRLASWIRANVRPITELLWRTTGHWDHLHLAMGTGGVGTAYTPTRMLVGENGPEDFAVAPLSRGGLRGGLAAAPAQPIVIENRGVIGSEAELERWLVGALTRARKRGLVGATA